MLVLGANIYVDSGDGYVNLELTEQCMARNDVRSWGGMQINRELKQDGGGASL